MISGVGKGRGDTLDVCKYGFRLGKKKKYFWYLQSECSDKMTCKRFWTEIFDHAAYISMSSFF